MGDKWNYEYEDDQASSALNNNIHTNNFNNIVTSQNNDIGNLNDENNTSTSSDVVAACEIIKDRFYFATLRCKPRSTSRTHYFTIENELKYENFYSDFGPLNLSHIYRYCQKVEKKLSSHTLSKKKIVHYTSETPNNRVNAAFLAGCYQIIYLNKKAEDVYKLLVCCSRQQQNAYKNDSNYHYIHLTHRSNITRLVLKHKHSVYKPYRDAALGPPLFLLTLLDCLCAVERAIKFNWLNFENFNVDEYEYYERVENGDLNWLIPSKFIAFCGPHNRSKIEDGYPLHAPESYFPLFRKYNVTDVIRLNKKLYNAKRFEDANFKHHDLFFIDGSCPNDTVLQKFLNISENRLCPENDNFDTGAIGANGVLAVHCKAGLGRTGTLIGAYIMKHYKWPASQMIAWIRICRPGSIIGPQQIYLSEMEESLFNAGDDYHKQYNTNITNLKSRNKVLNPFNFSATSSKPNNIPKNNEMKNSNCNITDNRLYKQVLAEQTSVSSKGLTQGDRLRAVKTMTQKSHAYNNNSPIPSNNNTIYNGNIKFSTKTNKSRLEDKSVSQQNDYNTQNANFSINNSQAGSLGTGMITRSRSKVELGTEKNIKGKNQNFSSIGIVLQNQNNSNKRLKNSGNNAGGQNLVSSTNQALHHVPKSHQHLNKSNKNSNNSNNISNLNNSNSSTNKTSTFSNSPNKNENKSGHDHYKNRLYDTAVNNRPKTANSKIKQETFTSLATHNTLHNRPKSSTSSIYNKQESSYIKSTTVTNKGTTIVRRDPCTLTIDARGDQKKTNSKNTNQIYDRPNSNYNHGNFNTNPENDRRDLENMQNRRTSPRISSDLAKMRIAHNVLGKR